MSNRFYSVSLTDNETLLLHPLLALSVILSFIMLSWFVKRIKNISKQKELSMHTEDLDSLHEIMCQLPDELIDQILVRLPEESLLRFKSVCHAWNAKINSPFFVKSYEDCKYSSMKVMLHTSDGELPIYSFSVNCREHEEQAVENIPHDFGSYKYKVVGSCDGLLLVQVKTRKRLWIWIWNPSTRQYIDLPFSNYSRMEELYYPRYGFGCVNSSGERNYKVLIIDDSKESKTFFTYSTFKKSWRRIDTDVPYGVSSNSLALVNAKLHFNAWNLNKEIVILAFDLEDEEFKELPRPNCVKINSVLELNGRLCIIASRGVHKKKRNVWVMKEYGVQASWTNMFCIDITNMTYLGGSCCSAWPLHFYVDGKILLHASYEIIIEDTEDSDSDQSQSECKKKLLVYYDSKNQTTTIPNQHALPNIFGSQTYVETLISPNFISP